MKAEYRLFDACRSRIPFCFSPRVSFVRLIFLKMSLIKKKEEKFRALNVHQRIGRKTPDNLDVIHPVVITAVAVARLGDRASRSCI